MKVITGTARGRSIRTLEGNAVRPTSQKVKEAMFSAIQFWVEGARVLDLFAGSGQLGIEALSRGAVGCTFVDMARESCGVVRDNLRSTGLGKDSKVVMADAVRFLASSYETYDIVFADPPYRKGIAESLVMAVGDVLSENGIFVLETEEDAEVPDEAPGISLQKKYRYGKTNVRIYRKAGEEA